MGWTVFFIRWRQYLLNDYTLISSVLSWAEALYGKLYWKVTGSGRHKKIQLTWWITSWIMNCQCDIVTKKRANAILGCINWNTGSRSSENVLSSLSSSYHTGIKCCIQLWTVHFKKHFDRPEHGQRKANTMIKALKKTCKGYLEILGKNSVWGRKNTMASYDGFLQLSEGLSCRRWGRVVPGCSRRQLCKKQWI